MNNSNSGKSVRECQKEALIRMLNFNGYFSTPEEDPIWKVLIFDSHTQDLISPILKVNDLKAAGVTVYRNICSLEAEKEAGEFGEVPLIFFVEPSSGNIDRICTILENDSSIAAVFVNFSSQLPRSLLERFAKRSVSAGFASKIFQVFDCLLDFSCIEENLFSFGIANSFQSLFLSSLKSHPDAEEAQARTKTLESISQKLFCLFCTTGQVPIIRCSAADNHAPSSIISRSLFSKLQDHLKLGKASIFSKKEKESLFVERPLLIVLDRSQDLITPLKHCWSYNQMIQDVFGIHSNRITLSDGKKADLDDMNDYFWAKYSSCPTYEVAGFVDQELGQYLQEKEKISHLTAASDKATSSEEKSPLLLDDDSKASGFNNESLKEAMEKIPMLTQKKALIDLHTSLATSLIKRVSLNKLDAYISLEAQIMQSKGHVDKNEVFSLISPDTAPGTPQDRLRLALIYCLRMEKDQSFSGLQAEIKQKLALPQFNSIIDQMIELLKHQSSCKSSSSALNSTSSSTSTSSMNSPFSTTKIVPLPFSERLGQVSGKIGGVLGNLVSGIKTFLPDSYDLPFTKITESLLICDNPVADSSNGGGLQNFLYLDPRQMKPSDRLYAPDKGIFNEIVVFVVGGSTWSERNSLSQLAQKYPKLKITLGTSEMLREFEKQFQSK